MKTPGGIVYQTLKLNKLRLFHLCWFLLYLLSSFIRFSCLFPAFSFSKVHSESVQFILSSEKKTETLFLFPGRISLLTLPCSITKALVGSPNDIKAEIDKLNSKEAHILLKKWRSEPSNLILKCGDRVFLFNLIPSKISHYDYIKVLNYIPEKPLKVKFPLPNTPSPVEGGLRERNFTIKKILDFSWEGRK